MTKSLPPKSLILYADDDPDDIELVSEIFQDHSEHIALLTFPDGIKLLDYIQSLAPLEPKPCLIIIDINMPRLNGKDVLIAIRQTEEFEEVPAVLFTTSTLPSEAAFAQNLNAGFITKPLNRNQMHEIFDNLVEHCSEDIKKRINRNRER